jgi:putative serine protease PepD
MRGWIPPDDRLWRHPSESAGRDPGRAPLPIAPDRVAGRDRTGPWLVGGATACVIVALVAAGLMVATTNRSDGGGGGTVPRLASLTDVPTTEPGVGQLPSTPTVAAMVARVRPSTVALIIDTGTGTSVGTGLVVEAGGIIVTTSRAVSSSRSITVVEPNGDRVAAAKVGTDPTSGISVLDVGDDLPPAVSDFTGPSSGSVAMAVAVEPSPRADQAPTPVVYAGRVVAAGVALHLDTVSTTFAAFGVEAPLSANDIGCPLLGAGGDVVGILERAGGRGLASASTFLPAELVWGVAGQLLSTGSVDSGWMGVTTTDAWAPSVPATPAGAVVASVTPGSPAAASGLEDGDVITGVDSYRVRSGAELDTRLYTEPVGAEVTVDFERAGTPLSRHLVLADADPDAPEHPSSP